MISLQALAANYCATTTDADGDDLDTYELRVSVERAIRRYLATKIRLVTAWGDDVPNIHRGELNAAKSAIRFAERDLADVAALRSAEATAAE